MEERFCYNIPVMNRYCLKCGKRLKKEELNCPSCHFDNDEKNLREMDIHEYKRLCYEKKTKDRSVRNRAYAGYVIGTVLLILGILFFILSFRYSLRHRVFTPDSVEFVFCVLCLCGALYFLVDASVRLVPSLRRERYFLSLLQKRK